MSSPVKDINKLKGVLKVAIVMLSLTDENATRVFSMMNEEEIMEISHAMSNLGSVNPDVIDGVIKGLNEDLSGSTMFHGNVHNTERLLEKILDKEKVQNLMDEIQGPQGKTTWEKLGHVNEELLALYLRNEHPQTASLVLSKISPEHAARVLSNLPDSFAFEIISRILNLGAVKKEVLERLEKVLRAEFISTTSKSQKHDSFEMLAEIFNNFDRNSESKFMSMLENHLPDAATKIKDKMFTFDDLVKIDTKGIQRILRDVEKPKLTLALKGASDELKNIIFSSMSQRAAKIIQDDILALGKVRVKDVDNARAEVVLTTKSLVDSGEVEISMDSTDEFVEE